MFEDILSKMSELLGNKALLSAISQLGAGMDKSGVAGGLNVLTQGLIKTDSYKDLLAKMLGGDIPEGGQLTLKPGEMVAKMPFDKNSIRNQIYEGLSQGAFTGNPLAVAANAADAIGASKSNSNLSSMPKMNWGLGQTGGQQQSQFNSISPFL
jgi:hypothetical protein